MTATKIKTVRDLRNFLEELETEWDELDRYGLGEFEDQELLMPSISKHVYGIHFDKFTGVEISFDPPSGITFWPQLKESEL